MKTSHMLLLGGGALVAGYFLVWPKIKENFSFNTQQRRGPPMGQVWPTPPQFGNAQMFPGIQGQSIADIHQNARPHLA